VRKLACAEETIEIKETKETKETKEIPPIRNSSERCNKGLTG